MFFDVHTHLEFLKEYQMDTKELVETSLAKGLKHIVSAGIDKQSNTYSLECSNRFPLILCGMGIHPEEVSKAIDLSKEIEFIEENSTKLKAISEIGLDATMPFMDKQIEVFNIMLKISLKLNIPAIIHTRNAELKVLEILEEYLKTNNLRKIILHCFSGKKALVQKAIQNKFYLSIPANLKRSEHFKMIVNLCPERQLLTETDSPFLSPIPNQINYPWNVIETVEQIAVIKSLLPKECKNLLYMNFSRLFL
ncbi:MAG TPA: TatD family hydrolase [Candidatus Woesearchaeota archaeon]|nr:TatD family hydrolase [Candidatus Woesearchaeota archaeon]